MEFKRAAFLTVIIAQGIAISSAAGGEDNLPSATRWAAVSEDELATQRGGFQLANGVTVDISIAKTLSVNGTVEYASKINLPDNLQSDKMRLSMNNGHSVINGISVLRNNQDNQLIMHNTVMNVTISHFRNLALLGAQHYIQPVNTALIH